ncbi:MAG: hypothetical protein WB676_04675 [Bryobacteraceae bacterium]
MPEEKQTDDIEKVLSDLKSIGDDETAAPVTSSALDGAIIRPIICTFGWY